MSSASELGTEYDEKIMRSIILKLLDKAGTDKRLTLRILRNKTEEKMKLQKGILKVKRDMIKSLTYKWWKVNQTNSNNTATEPAVNKSTKTSENSNSSASADIKTSKPSSEEWKQLEALAKAVGKSIFIKTIDKQLSEKEKSNKLRKKLRDLDLKFSDIPTIQEIEKLKKTHEAKSGSDSTATISKSNDSSSGVTRHIHNKPSLSTSDDIKKRKLEEISSSSNNAVGGGIATSSKNENSGTGTKNSSNAANPHVIRRVIYDSDEEVGDF